MNKGCSTVATSLFINATNIISSLDSGKLRAYLADNQSLGINEFCLKVTDSTCLIFDVDNLSLDVKAGP